MSRPRLLAQIEKGLEHRLSLVAAPAGYGKTTLLSEGIRWSRLPVGWLALDEGDIDPPRFWTYFIAALENVQARMGESALDMFQPSQQSPLEPLLTALINEMSEVGKDFVLVLDDYQVIESQPIHDGPAFLLGHLPSNAHLAVAS